MSIGPLTTTFSPVPSCSSITHGWYLYNGKHYSTKPTTTATTDEKVDWYLSLGPSYIKYCVPSSYATGESYYSPGICPSGYDPAGQGVTASDNAVVTTATCCPRGYNAQTGSDHDWYSTNPCTSSNTDSAYVYTYSQGSSVTSHTGVFGINARGISIRWKSDDFATSTTSTTSTSASTSTNSSASSGSSTGLTSGAKVGIGVGIGIGVPLLLAMLYIIYLVRKRSAKETPASPGYTSVGQQSHSQPLAGYYTTGTGTQVGTSTTGTSSDMGQVSQSHDQRQSIGTPVFEMSSQTNPQPQEMSSGRQ